MSTTIWQILNMKLIQWPEPEIIWTAENCLEKFVKSHQVNLISADYSQFEPLCNRQTKTENIFLDLWLWIIRCRRTRPKRRRLRLFFSAASKLNFGDNDVIVKKKQKENSFWYLSSLRYDTTTTMKMKNIIYSRLNKIYTANVDNFLLRAFFFFFFFFSLCCCFKK